ncbi:MAG: PAS domain S-box protein [Vicinamibacteria bacterium]
MPGAKIPYQPAAIPEREADRLEALHEYRVLDTPPEDEFDGLARLAAQICGTPIALVSLVDAHRQWFKARIGMAVTETPREVAFCAHAILDHELFVINDAQADARFSQNPLVTQEHIRFYAGAPLLTPEGHSVGTLCVMDRLPRELDAHQRDALRILSGEVMARFELKRALRDALAVARERDVARLEVERQTYTLRAVLGAVGEGLAVADADRRIHFFSRVYEDMFGAVESVPEGEWPDHFQILRPDGVTPFPAEELPLVRALDGERVDDVEICMRDEKRVLRWWNCVARPMHDQRGRQQGAVVAFRDVTAHRRSEAILRVQHAATSILSEKHTLAEAARPLLEAIGGYLNRELGELWEVDNWSDVLRATADWHRPGSDLASFAEAGNGLDYARGDGLPGRVWKTARPAFARVGDDEDARNQLAVRLGFKTVLGFPIVSGSEIVGVIVTWSREEEAPEPELMAALGGIGAQVGQFVARRRSEAVLRASEQRMRHVFERMPYPGAIFDDATLRFLAVNDAAVEKYGWSREEFLDMTLPEICPLEDLPRLGQALETQLPTFVKTAVWRTVCKGGAIVHAEVSSLGLEIDGRPARCLFAKDLTEQMRDEAQMSERLAVSALGAAVSTALTWGGTLHRKLQDCAEALVHQLGLEMAGVWKRAGQAPTLELMGGAVRSGVLPASQATLPADRHWLGMVADTRVPHWLDLVENTTPSDLGWARDSGMRYLAGYPLLVEARSMGVLAVGTRRPLTQAALEALPPLADEIALHLEREEVRTALTASEAHHRAVIENLLGGLLVVDERGFIESANAEAERIFGYGPTELMGQHLSVLMPSSMSPDYPGALREAFKRAIGKITEWEGRRRSGEQFPFELGMYEIKSDAGRRFGGHIRDLSERREVERLKKEFVAVVSHELRTPLTSVRGSLSLLANGALGELPDEAKEVVAIAERNTVRLMHLINDILDLERLEAGRMPMYVSLHPLKNVFDRSLESVRVVADQQDVSIEVVPTEARVLGDADRLVQVLVNLMSNAVKFSPRKSVVTVRAKDEAGFVEVSVRDRGRGIPVSHQEAIFQRFQQVESSDGRQKGGTGLGLPICKAIVEQLGGTLKVASTPGEGSTFTFRLRSGWPEPRPDTLLAAIEEAIPDDARDVLMVDEDQALLGVVGRQLLAAGIPVRTASTVRQGLEQAQARPPALLMLDMRFPDGDGFALVRELSKDERLRATPLLVYTARDLSEAERARLSLGQKRFLVKSQATEQELLHAVRELCGHREAS